ncbi:MAG: FkbM family methyltransferase [Halorhabdus sp.]
MLSATTRLSELYADGGVAELHRGIRDYLLFNTGVPLHRLHRRRDLVVGGQTVTFRIDSTEALVRSDGHGERPILDEFAYRVDSDDVVWDVGANMGSYSLLAGSIGAEVVAFEPGPRARLALLDNARLNEVDDSIDATPYALADWDGPGVLLPASRSGVRELARDADEGDTVPVRRGDDLDVPAPDVVKIDVEGAEVAVLDGMADRLAACRLCYVEVHEGVDVEAVRERLETAGLEVTEIRITSRADHTFLRGEEVRD